MFDRSPEFPGRLRRAAAFAAAAVALSVAATGCHDAETPPPRTDVERAPDFTLTDQHGRPFRLSDQRGHLVLLFFGYTYCPDVCPTALATWARVQSDLGDAAKDVEFVFITVDPERDSAERLAQHLAVFSPRFLGLRGTPAELAGVYDAYRVVPQKVVIGEGASGYLVNHPGTMTLVDRDGRIAARFDYRKYPPEITAELRRRLGAPAPAATLRAAAAIRVENAWSWPTAGTPAETEPDADVERGPGVAYLSIHNDGDLADRLVAVHTDVCAEAELHETRETDGRLRMVPVEDGLSIPPGGIVKLEPGGAHIMLMGLHRDLRPGDRFELVLVFEHAGELAVESEVRRP